MVLAEKPKKVLEQTENLIARTCREISDLVEQEKLLEFISHAVINAHAKFNRKQLEAMLKTDIRKTKIYQEAREVGREVGREEAKREVQRDIVHRLRESC